MPDTIRAHAGEILELTLTSFSGVSHDVKALIVDATINMSLFNKAIFGTFTLVDGVGIHYLLPLIGEETFSLSFRSRGREIKELKGHIISCSDQEFDDSYQSMTYTLDFVSEIGFQNIVANKVSHYTNAQPADAIRDIANNFLDLDKFVETLDEPYARNVEIIYPKITPFGAIDMICARTYEGRSNRSSMFVFFEDLDAYRFVNIESLFEQTVVPDYFFDVFESGASKTRDKEFYRIIDMSFKQKFDTVSRINNGLIDSELIRFDPITKRVNVSHYHYNEDARNFTPLDGSTFIPSATSNFMTRYEHKDDTTTDIGRTALQSYKVQNQLDPFEFKRLGYGKAMEILESIMQTQIDITVPGHTGRRPGDLINIPSFPRGTSFKAGTNREEYLEGRYLVTGVKHTFNQGEITTILSLAKPQFAKPIVSVEI